MLYNSIKRGVWISQLAKFGLIFGFIFIFASHIVAKEIRFASLKTKHAIIFYQDGVSKDRAYEVGDDFEIAYKVVGKDLGYPKKRPRLYVYHSNEDGIYDLMNRWGYGDWVKKYGAVPHMNWNYEAWIPPNKGVDFITHEYAHRIIQQIAGFDFQKKYNLFDEGLAEYEGLKALAVKDKGLALAKEREWLKNVLSAYKHDKLIPFKEMMTEEQWDRFFEANPSSSSYMYNQCAVAICFLINQYGFDKIKKVLTIVGQGESFPNAFQKVYNLSIEEFEERFIVYLDSLKDDIERLTTLSRLILVSTATTQIINLNSTEETKGYEKRNIAIKVGLILIGIIGVGGFFWLRKTGKLKLGKLPSHKESFRYNSD